MNLAPANPSVEGLRPPGQGPNSNERPTRPALRFWDRIKFIVLFTAMWFLLCWAAVANNPILPFNEAMRLELTSAAWLLVLLGIEIVRQVHFVISEHSAAYHRFWTKSIFGRAERVTERRLSPWTRFRLARVIKWVVFLALFIYIVSEFMETSPALAMFELPALIWQALPMILQIVFIVAIGILQFVAIFWFMSRGGVDTYFPDDIKTRFIDVWGQDHVLDRVKENIVFLERPHEIEEKGGYVPSGILLWGPPGTGKTLMAEAVAGETGKPYVFVDPGAFQNMFFGVGILKVKALFRKLRKLALRYGGVIVFFDEADSLGSRGAIAGGGSFRATAPAPFHTTGCHGFSYLSDSARSTLTRHAMAQGGQPAPLARAVIPAGMGGGGGGMGTLQALLTELSGLKKPRGFVNRHVRRVLGMRPKPPPKYRILVMMATNMPDSLDEALLRPGRIDRIYKVGYPNKAGRIRTYEGYFNKVRHELTAADVDKLATITPYATGATIKDIVNEALITAIRDGREVISWHDVIKSKQLKELGPPEDNEYIERERHAIAVHEACHAVIAYRTRKHLEIDLATIEKGGDYLGMVKSIKPEDQFGHWRSEYEADIFVSLASLAGERMFFEGDSTSGVSGDLESATLVASQMEAYFGMGSTVSSLSAAHAFDTGTPGGGGPWGGGSGSDAENARLRLADRIENSLAAHLEKTAQMLRENRREVLVLAHALETHKTMTGDDVAAVVEGRPGPTIDGTPYNDPDFVSQIEVFHHAAVNAHRAHGSISIPLPTPPVAGPAAQWRAPGAPILAVAAGDSAAMGEHAGGNGGSPAGTSGGQATDGTSDAVPPSSYPTSS